MEDLYKIVTEVAMPIINRFQSLVGVSKIPRHQLIDIRATVI